MPRQPRLDLAQIAQYAVQRGNDRQACFFVDMDRVPNLQDSRELSLREDRKVHANLLITNHPPLLVAHAASGQIDRVMHSLRRRRKRDGGS